MDNTVSLQKNIDFKKVYKRGKNVVNHLLVVYFLKNRYNQNRLGIVINKKVGKAVVRNRIRRLIKENYRLQEQYIRKGYDIVFVSRVRAREASYDDISKAMSNLLKRANLLDLESSAFNKDDGH